MQKLRMLYFPLYLCFLHFRAMVWRLEFNRWDCHASLAMTKEEGSQWQQGDCGAYSDVREECWGVRSEVSEAGGSSGTCVNAGEGKVLIGNQAGPGNITKTIPGFLPLYYRLLDCCFKSHELVLEAFHFHLQFLTPSIGYHLQYQNLNRSLIACLWPKSPAPGHRGFLGIA